MSSALAIAGVTAVLRDLLDNGLIDHDATASLGVSISVSIGPPDRVIPTNGGTEATQLNLFMYQVTPNTGWRNEGLPSRDTSGSQRLTNAPLALNLHYLISAHASEELHGEILLGYAMQFLHETPVLSRKAIKKALSPSPIGGGSTLTSAMKALADSGLENQIEQIKITPEYLNTEEISKLWTATQSHLRPTAAYMASVVLIEATQPTRSPLPVLTRGSVDQVTHRERGVIVEPGLVPPLPMLDAVVPDKSQPVAQLDVMIELQGNNLDAEPPTDRTVRLTNDRFQVDQKINPDTPVSPKISATSVPFTIAKTDADKFPVGVYSVSVQLIPLGEDNLRETNLLAMTLAPKITKLSPSPLHNGDTLHVEFLPSLREGQQAVLVVGQQEFLPQTPATFPAPALDFNLTNVSASPPSGSMVRLRIDGIESPIIDRSTTPPTFLNQRIIIT